MSETNGREKGLASDRGVELLHHEEHEEFSRRGAGLSVLSAQTGSGKIGVKDEE